MTPRLSVCVGFRMILCRGGDLPQGSYSQHRRSLRPKPFKACELGFNHVHRLGYGFSFGHQPAVGGVVGIAVDRLVTNAGQGDGVPGAVEVVDVQGVGWGLD